jgi:hypothetical protein
VRERRGIVSPEAASGVAVGDAVGAVGRHNIGNSSRLPGWVV